MTTPESLPLPSSSRILLCGSSPLFLRELLAVVDEPSAEVDSADTPATAIERLTHRPFDVCIVDITWDSSALSELLSYLGSTSAATHVLRLADTAEESVAAAGSPVEVVPLSAPPVLIRKLLRSSVQKAKLQSENRALRRQLQARVATEIPGQSVAVRQLRDDVLAAADADDCVLIHGEPGTGSQNVARVVHLASRRAVRPFLVLDCLVHTAESLEAELWGDADESEEDQSSGGLLEACAGGTLLLKNVDSLPVAAQRKLADLVRRGSIVSPISAKSKPLDVRLIASTHVDLGSVAQAGRFHLGLYERLTARQVCIPSLRDRMEDLALLTEQVLTRLGLVEGKPVKRLSVEALKVLRLHDWPGNLAELENVIERACTVGGGVLLTAESLRPWIGRPVSTESESSGLSLREMERKLIEATFNRCRGNREETARLLQIGIRTLSGKLREYGYPPRGGPGSNRTLTPAA